jgi:hypothetical protein
MKQMIILIIFIACVFAYQSRMEGFESPQIDSPVMEYPPNGPSPADVDTNHPYHLLSDRLASHESLSCVNSRTCYATDFKRSIEKTGNYRQMTNNYKRNYPDNCSSWNQELTLAFYKTESIGSSSL